MPLPEKFLDSLMGIPGFDKEAFEKLHESAEPITSIRLNPAKSISRFPDFSMSPLNKVPWAKSGFYLSERPSFTFDPLFHAGCYYVQEASSMFLEQALEQTTDLSHPLKILDLAAAPGGKTTHIQSLISNGSLLVSNEVIKSRSQVLKDNVIKWGCKNAVVTNNDPRDFAGLENYFDVIVVDAPCSGSGLFRRDKAAIKEWSESNVQLCSRRQQRVLADVWPALKKDGVLIYSTCSYSKEEDEDIIKWMHEEFKSEYACLPLRQEKLKLKDDWNIVETPEGCRFWPDKLKGEGFFISCLRKLTGGIENAGRIQKRMNALKKDELRLVRSWVKETGYEFVKLENNIYAIPAQLVDGINFLYPKLDVIYFGVFVGEIKAGRLIPSHALAMSNLVSENPERIELNKEQAIDFLKKKELKGIAANKGWKMVLYKNHPLGWINILSGRINNYYPKQLRILKDI